MTPTRELFQKHQLRCTRQRLALYEALRQTTGHPTAEELYLMARTKRDPMSRATVYNTLEALCRAGLARRMPTVSGCCRYDADTSDHLHFRCRATARIHDVPPELGRQLLEGMPKGVLAQIEKSMGVKIEAVSVQLLGCGENGSRAG